MASRDLLAWPVAASLLLLLSLARGDHDPDAATTTSDEPTASAPFTLAATGRGAWDDEGAVASAVAPDRRTVLVVGVVFLSGVVVLFACCCVNFCLSCCHQLRVDRQRRRAAGRCGGVANVAFVGDDRPPDYSAVLAQDRQVGSFVKSDWRTSLATSNGKATEELPPSYDSVAKPG